MIKPGTMRSAPDSVCGARRARRFRPGRPYLRYHRPRSEILEDRLALATVFWATDASGNWNTASDWSAGAVPGPSDDVITNRSASVSVTIGSGSQSVHSLQVNSNETLSLSGSSLAVSAGALINGSFLASGNGTVAGTFTGGTSSVAQLGGGTLTTGSGGQPSTSLTSSGRRARSAGW
jgi:hypothetical protein